MPHAQTGLQASQVPAEGGRGLSLQPQVHWDPAGPLWKTSKVMFGSKRFLKPLTNVNHCEFGGFPRPHRLCRGPGRRQQRERRPREAGFIRIRPEEACWRFEGKEAGKGYLLRSIRVKYEKRTFE